MFDMFWIFICTSLFQVFLSCSSLFPIDLNAFLMIPTWVVRLCRLVSWRISHVFIVICMISSWFDARLLILLMLWIFYMYDCVSGVFVLCSSLFWLTLICSWWLLNELFDCFFSEMKEVLCALSWFWFLREVLVLVSSSEFLVRSWGLFWFFWSELLKCEFLVCSSNV